MAKRQWITLRNEWYQKLEDEGFKDIEDRKGRLKSHDTRTILFNNRKTIFQFYTRLDHFLSKDPEIPQIDREVLERYAKGMRLNRIAIQMIEIYGPCKAGGPGGHGIWKIRDVIKKYKERF